MVEQNLDSLQSPGDAPPSRPGWSSMAPLAGAVVLISMLASAHAFQPKSPKEAVAPQATKTDAPKPVVVKRGRAKPSPGSAAIFWC